MNNLQIKVFQDFILTKNQIGNNITHIHSKKKEY